MGKFVVVDGNSLTHRAFHALPPMNNSEGTPTQAVYGFLSMLFKMIDLEQPTHLLVAFDTKAPTARHEAYSEYKAGRKATPDELCVQFPLIKEVLAAMNIATGEQDGFEADDFLGIFSRRGEAEGLAVRLITGDRDALQLVTDNTHVILTKKGISETETMDCGRIFEKYGVTPEQMIQVKGLMGDASDNIPGIPGVGEKTALKLIQSFGDVESVIANVDQVNGAKLKEKIITFADQARLSRDIGIVRIDIDAPIPLSVADCAFERQKMTQGREVLQRLELRSLLSRLPKGDVVPRSAEPAGGTGLRVRPFEQVIEDEAALEIVSQKWLQAGELALIWDGGAVTVCDGVALWRVCLQQDLLSQGVDWTAALRALAPILQSGRVKKRLYDAKQWMHWLAEQHIALAGECFDAMVAAYLLQPARSRASFAVLASERWGEGDADAFALFGLCDVLGEELRQKGLWELFHGMEMPLARVLFDMETLGFAVDETALGALGELYSEQLEQLQEEIYALAGESFNILSPKQLAGILFEKLGLSAQRKTKTGYSTDADTLEALIDKHEIVPKILEYRQIAKLKSTYIDGLLAAADKQGRVHTRFDQTVTATGRISSNEPNLQNIPVRTEMGREIRKAFVAPPGHVLVDGDYSQIELRVLAHIAQDPVMLDSFAKGEDIHARTAAEVAGCAIGEVTGAMRSAAKAVNFGIVYGISDFGLARQLGISRKEASGYIAAYLDKYCGIAAYMKDIVEKGKLDGYVSTLFGRRRELPELKSRNYNVRSFGERVAMNAPIQGTAADIIKIAMIRVHEVLQNKELHAKLILQVHDELIVEAPKDEAEKVAALLKQCMEEVVALDAPLLVEVRTGYSWYETK